MLLVLYDIGIRLYYTAAWIFSFFYDKARRWIKGRDNQVIKPMENCTWFHFASLGEFEQGRPVMEMLKERFPETTIVATFFSPSGYEIRKNTHLANEVYYLPLDTRANAISLIKAIKPTAAVFTKYEYWYHYFNELHKRKIPIYVISGIFRKRQAFFKWYGTLHRAMLKMVTYFYVQDHRSIELLNGVGVYNATVSGDTRFDRVWTNATNPVLIPEIKSFKDGSKLFIAGSTWPEDEKLLANLIERYPGWKFIFAPHELAQSKLDDLMDILPSNAICYSKLPQQHAQIEKYRVLVIDNIGMLSTLYQYGDVAYIGGGFGKGIHNILEAAAFGLPVIFGPNYKSFKEANDIIELKAGASIANGEDLLDAAKKFMDNDSQRQMAGEIIKNYVEQNRGATERIFNTVINPGE